MRAAQLDPLKQLRSAHSILPLSNALPPSKCQSQGRSILLVTNLNGSEPKLSLLLRQLRPNSPAAPVLGLGEWAALAVERVDHGPGRSARAAPACAWSAVTWWTAWARLGMSSWRVKEREGACSSACFSSRHREQSTCVSSETS